MSAWKCSWDAFDLLILGSGPARGDLIGLRATYAATVYKALVDLTTAQKVTDGFSCRPGLPLSCQQPWNRRVSASKRHRPDAAKPELHILLPSGIIPR